MFAGTITSCQVHVGMYSSIYITHELMYELYIIIFPRDNIKRDGLAVSPPRARVSMQMRFIFVMLHAVSAVRMGVAPSRRAVLASAVAALGSNVLEATAEDSLSFEIIESGDISSSVPQRAQTVVVDYTGWLGGFEGKEFDSTKGRLLPVPRPPSPFKFAAGVGSVIPGWDQTVRQMHIGETRRIIVPPSLGYGEKGVGPIPGGATLYFEIKLLDIKPMPTLSEKQLAWLAEHPER